jgi:O-methyltransferase involved in polyketide biosynthesis
LGEPIRFDGQKSCFEIASGLMTQLSKAVLAEVFERLVVALPPISMFVIFAGL